MQKKFPPDMFGPSDFWYVSVGDSHMFSSALLPFQGIPITAKAENCSDTRGEGSSGLADKGVREDARCSTLGTERASTTK